MLLPSCSLAAEQGPLIRRRSRPAQPLQTHRNAMAAEPQLPISAQGCALKVPETEVKAKPPTPVSRHSASGVFCFK